MGKSVEEVLKKLKIAIPLNKNPETYIAIAIWKLDGSEASSL